MILVMIVVAVVAALIYCHYLQEEYAPNITIDQLYTEDIDWSLAVKGYPVVNDIDIQYTEYKARN